MSRSDRRPILAIGIDAAEPSLVRRLCDTGALPRLRALRECGIWSRVSAPAEIGSGALWPSFLTGSPPSEHGLYGEWVWRPDAMRVSRPTSDHLTPFWATLARRDRTATVLDLPFAPLAGVPGCVEVLNWGAHDYVTSGVQVYPPALRGVVTGVGGRHPFAAGEGDVSGPGDGPALRRMAASCMAGVRERGELACRLLAETRPDLFLLVFTEVHRASHLLWHTVAPPNAPASPGWPRSPMSKVGRAVATDLTSALPALLGEVDRQIGRLIDGVGPDATVLVFSLHGMRPTCGIPTILAPLLRALGQSVVKNWRSCSWPERVNTSVAAAKRHVPAGVKQLYRRVLGRAITGRLAQPAMPMPSYDWSRTTAFSLPTDQHGWIRINLRGREASGIVDPRDYDATCARLETLLRRVTTEDGRPLVADVLRLAAPGAPHPRYLPDLIVHWAESALVADLRLREPPVSARPVGLKLTGQHTPDGFCVWRPGMDHEAGPGDPVSAEDLHRIILGSVG